MTTLAGASLAIAARQEFTAGPMHGTHVRWMPSTGRLSSDLVADLDRCIRANRNNDRATYVVSSYGTPIAWTVDDELYVPTARYSVTTAKHQRACHTAAVMAA